MEKGTVRARHAAEMRRVVGGFEKSGLTQAAYCRTRGITVQQFHYWQKKAGSAPSFVEIEVERDHEGGGAIELRLPGGVVAVVGVGTKTSLIRRVLKAARSC
jgi:hypothetical protein